MSGIFNYTEKDLLGGWKIEVRKGPTHIGNIRKNPSTGAFQYFKGLQNQLNPSFEESSLEKIKNRIELKA